MRKKIETKKKFRRICALVVVGMFVAMTPMSVSAQPNPENWSKYGDVATDSDVLGTLNSEPLRIITNGMERIHVTSDGKVGIGTVDPIYALHVRDFTPTIPEVGTTIAIESSVSSITPGDPLGTILFMGPYEEGMWGTGAMIRAEASGPFIFENPNISPTSLQFYTQDATPFDDLVTPRMVITDEGNVGIGTTKPMAKVHIIQDGMADAFWVDDQASDTTPFVIDQFGNVGIGTTSPNCKLHVIGDANITGSLYAGSLNVDSGALYIDDVNDRVGIGTMNPQYTLDVDGDIHASGTLSCGNSITIDGDNDKITASSGTIDFEDENLVTTGTITAQKLEISGKIVVGDDGTPPTAGAIRWNGANFQGYTGTEWKDLDVQATSGGGWTDGGANVYLTTLSDSVGIGVTNPGEKLEVDGNIKLTGGDNWIGVSGTDGVFIKYNGDIGIGTVTPGKKLDVDGAIRGTTLNSGLGDYELYAMNQNVRTTDNPTFNRVYISDYGYALGGFHVGGTSDPGTDNLIVDGNVGIGTTSPTVELDVNGDAKIVDSLEVDSGTLYVDNVNNYVGIGDITPDAKLDVYGGAIIGISNTATGNTAIALGYQSDANGDYSIAIGRRATTASTADYATALGGLDVTASSFCSTAIGGRDIIASGQYSTAIGGWYYTEASGWASIAIGSSVTASGIYSVGIGAWVTASGDNSMVIGYGGLTNNIDDSLMVGFGYSPTLFVDGSSVGIGTTNPQYKLDVEGYVQAYGYYTGDIIFQKEGEKHWRMFEDEDGLYLESFETGKVYEFVLHEKKK